MKAKLCQSGALILVTAGMPDIQACVPSLRMQLLLVLSYVYVSERRSRAKAAAQSKQTVS